MLSLRLPFVCMVEPKDNIKKWVMKWSIIALLATILFLINQFTKENLVRLNGHSLLVHMVEAMDYSFTTRMKIGQLLIALARKQKTFPSVISNGLSITAHRRDIIRMRPWKARNASVPWKA